MNEADPPTGKLHARIFFGSDDEQGQLPPKLPPIGIVPIIGRFPETQPVTMPFHALCDDGTSASILATIFSDFDPTSGTVSDALRVVPTPGTAVLLAMGCFGALRRRR